MSETKIIVRRNSLNLPTDQLTRIEKAVDKREISPVSAEKEAGLFLMYCMGDELDTIAEQTALPRDVVALTALTYDWQTKAQEIKKYRNGEKVGELQKDLINTILIATYASIKRELALVIAGKKEAYEVPLIPRKIEGLEKLMKMVSEINNLVTPALPSPGNGGTIIQAQNVQVNQSAPSEPGVVKTRAEKLRELREKQK